VWERGLSSDHGHVHLLLPFLYEREITNSLHQSHPPIPPIPFFSPLLSLSEFQRMYFLNGAGGNALSHIFYPIPLPSLLTPGAPFPGVFGKGRGFKSPTPSPPGRVGWE